MITFPTSPTICSRKKESRVLSSSFNIISQEIYKVFPDFPLAESFIKAVIYIKHGKARNTHINMCKGKKRKKEKL